MRRLGLPTFFFFLLSVLGSFFFGCSKASFYPALGATGGAAVGSLGGPGAAAGGAGSITKADLERLIAAAKETAPAQVIRVEQAPIKIVTDSDQPPYKM